MKKHIIFTGFLIVICAVIVFSYLHNDVNKGSLIVRYGYQPTNAQVIIAKELGWFNEEFKTEGINFEFKQFLAGPPLVEALASNQLDIGQVGDQPAIQARANHVDLKAIAVYASSDKNCGLITGKNSSIKGMQDLKGKKIGVAVGTVAHVTLISMLNAQGLTQDEVKIVNLKPGDTITAQKTQNIEAAVLYEPYLSYALKLNVGELVMTNEGLKLNVDVIVANNSFASNNKVLVARILKVLSKTEKWIAENPTKARDIIAKDAGASVDLLYPALDVYNLDMRFTDQIVKSVDDTSQLLLKNGIIKNPVRVEDLIDESYLKAAGIEQ